MTFLTWIVTVVLAATQAAAEPQRAQRFDYQVRADFFAGVAGDDARMNKAMEFCERTLAENPRHAEAMVWHGAGTFFRAGQAFQKGDTAGGGQLFGRAMKEMDDAVALAPDNPGVLIPRAAVLLEGTRAMPPDAARPLVESAVANYEHVLDIQASIWPTLGDHGKGELLFGLAEGSARLGRLDKARVYFERLIKDAPTSGQIPKAQQWISTGTLPKSNGTSCVGCHK